jgi:glycosyltransferase involved in cell wall biosynthesis
MIEYSDNGAAGSTTSGSAVGISVVLPIHNEEENLRPLLSELRRVMDGLNEPYEIICVDDGSSDNSFAVLEQLHEQHGFVKVIRFRRNYGQSAAFSAGFDFASGDRIVTIDADGQNDPEDIPRLLVKLQEGNHDIVFGWRVQRREPLIRRLVSRAANGVIGSSSRIHIHDRGCSLKALRRETVADMRLYRGLHRFFPELVCAMGADVAEIPVNDRPRMSGQSNYQALGRTPQVLLDLITVLFMLGFFTRPMRFFGSFALAAFGLGGALTGGLVLAKIYHGLQGGWAGFHAFRIGHRPLLLLGAVLILLSVQFLMMGLIGEMIMRTYYESQNKRPYAVRTILN